MNDHAVYLHRINERLRAEFTWNERKALDAAIAALEAGRSGEAEFLHEMLCTRFSEFPKVLDPDASNTTEAVYWAIGEFLERQRPQQPPPVGVTLPARMEPPKEGYRDTSAHEALAHLSTTLADWLPEPDAAEADLATVVAYVQKLEAALREQPAPAGDGECNCHRHGKAEFCPLHTQADYDSDTAAGRSGEARELLARQYEQADPDYAEVIRAGEPLEEDDMRALRAIEAAAPQQPPPVGGWSVATIPIGMAEGADRFRVEMKRGNQYFHVGPTSFVDREDADLYAGILRRALSHQQPAPSVSDSGKWVCGFCRRTYTLDAICCQQQRDYRARHQPAAMPEPAASGGESLEMGEYDKVIHDAVEHGSGWMQNGKHIPRDQVYAASGEGLPEFEKLLDELGDACGKTYFFNVTQQHPPGVEWLPMVRPIRQKVIAAARRLTTTGHADAWKLAEIKQIIENVDNRAMAGDGPIPSTMQTMTQQELSRIYILAGGKPNVT